ncbi:hypothetical protein DM01DRAFT_1339822 [Hesseltinella vesiculosa]|uniref:Zn(2)-C6 fungal-type domain-containing protein n=1 Tax=Hesseltinella vesiculosa TaxID=101127 RepID=A0A1X2G5V5_9FUNG|nr:hypothetical protein DM01DRAFT_1339822 [Hesseltinella vesiculosa]
MSDESNALPMQTQQEPATKQPSKPDTNKNDANLNAACYRCRGFRHACDRKRPSCTRCAKRGLNCTYPEAAPTLKKLQKATETLGDRIKKFSDRLKTGEGMPTISLQRLARVQTPGLADPSQPSALAAPSPDTLSIRSFLSDSSEPTLEGRSPPARPLIHLKKKKRVILTTHFSVYPCSKCFKDLQQCDLSLPHCSRCEANGFECVYTKTEPKANHVSQVLNTMNKMMDQWQESIDKMAKDFAQKTRDFSARANHSLKIKPMQPFAWKITSTNKGLSMESSVNSYNDLSTLVDQFKRSLNISPKHPDTEADGDGQKRAGTPTTNTTSPATPGSSPMSYCPSSYSEMSESAAGVELELDDTSSITSSTFSFAIWSAWAHPTHAMPQDYPIDITQDLTDNLVELFCRTPCCSAIRLPFIDLADFLARYRDPDPAKRPATVLVYAISAMAARNAFQLHIWSKRPAFEAPQYNMGKALSLAYTLRGRELLADCFDEPSMDHCQAAFILSYSNQQNGFPGVIYIYEWIAYTMAQNLGLYDPHRELTQQERMLVWSLYYYNTWYRVLQGGPSLAGHDSPFYPKCPLPDIPPIPAGADTPSPNTLSSVESTSGQSPPATSLASDTTLIASDHGKERQGSPSSSDDHGDAIYYYVSALWVYQIDLQLMREQLMARLVTSQQQSAAGKSDPTLAQDLLAMQAELDHFYHQRLPPAWRNLSILTQDDLPKDDSKKADTSAQLGSANYDMHAQPHSVDCNSFGQYCVLYFHCYYYINVILLYQTFFPSDRIPTADFAVQSLHVCMNACANVTRILEIMANRYAECNVPLITFIFANLVHVKLLNYNQDVSYQAFAIYHLQKSVDIAKASSNYTYDFELSRTFVNLMEQDIQQRLQALNLPPLNAST